MMMHFCFVLKLLLLRSCLMQNSAMAITNIRTDELSLLEFKSRISDPNNVLTSNWSTASSSVCNWIGISCGSIHGRVTELNLTDMGLEGNVPPQLGNLSFLVSLDLSNNRFHGFLPKEMAQLHRLKLINFTSNELNGDIPSWFGMFPVVQSLSLAENNFTGKIPPTLFNLSNLESLDLSGNLLEGIPSGIVKLPNLKVMFMKNNKLSGSVPLSIFNLSSLQMIDLSYNNLSGSLPDDMCRGLQNLELLSLVYNDLFGQIPSSIGKCSMLQVFALYNNRFTGLIPSSIGNLTRLKQLSSSDNLLEGEIPYEVGYIHSLELLAFGRNNFTGSIPSTIFNLSMIAALGLEENHLSGLVSNDIGKLQNLERLALGRNNFIGMIPFAVFNITTIEVIGLEGNLFSGQIPYVNGFSTPNLVELRLWSNDLGGMIPSYISNASNLRILQLNNNSFSGLMPNTFGNLRFLQLLNLARNNLTTETPKHEWDFLADLANCKHLTFLAISSNPLNGVLPKSIGNLSSSLEQFYAVNCKIRGSIPSEIGNLSKVIVLSLYNNEFSGPIPGTLGKLWNLQALAVQDNRLQGEIPSNVCQLKGLFLLSVSANSLHGPIPPCLSNLTSLQYLYLSSNKLNSSIPVSLFNPGYILELDLSTNMLVGSIPVDIGNLKVLTVVNLSRNLLSGEIPNTFGKLQDLVSLNLSGNRLTSSIPESFSSLTSLEFLNLSSNNLSGVIPKSLEKLSHLTYFNVSFNRLEGEIPTGGPFKNFSAESFKKNFALCGSPQLLVPPCKSSSSSRTKLVLKYVLPTTISTVLVSVAIFVFLKSRKRKSDMVSKADSLPLAHLRRISYHELVQATNRFSELNLIGSGSFGSVYKGTLPDGLNIAVKVFRLELEGAAESFDAECEVLRNIRHRNLVRIISSCSNDDFKALVLEFMPNASLEKWLYSDNSFLDVFKRLDIMIDVASALEYLHHGNPTPMAHCDLKPSNVLLDEEMVAHVADFGISRLLGAGNSVTQTTTMATLGYMAPEYGSLGIVSTKGDVYSYGVLLMETFTAKKPTDEEFGEEMSLRNWVQQWLSEGRIRMLLADAGLLREEVGNFIAMADCIASVMRLALDCSAELREERRNMREVVAMLKKIKFKFLKDIQQGS